MEAVKSVVEDGTHLREVARMFDIPVGDELLALFLLIVAQDQKGRGKGGTKGFLCKDV